MIDLPLHSLQNCFDLLSTRVSIELKRKERVGRKWKEEEKQKWVGSLKRKEEEKTERIEIRLMIGKS